MELVNNISKKFLLILVLLFSNILVHAQEEWVVVPIFQSWRTDSQLTCYSKTLDLLHIYNSVAETKEDKKNNRFTTKDASLYFFQSDSLLRQTVFEISFKLRNLKDPENYKFKTYQGEKEVWYKGNIYYGVVLKYKDCLNNNKTYTVWFCDDKYGGSSHREVIGSTELSWRRDFNYSYHGDINIKISCDGKGVLHYSADGVSRYFSDFGTLTDIEICAGTAAELKASDLIVKKKTIYGMVKPLIDNALELMEKEEWYEASQILTQILNLYKDYYILLYRATCYFSCGFYQSAIVDFTEALVYIPENEKEYIEDVYFKRGLCKFAVEDIDGAIEDFYKGGQNGMIILRENNLIDYKPNSNTEKNSYTTKQKKPLTK